MSVNRSTGVTVAAVLTFSGAMILALASCAFFVVGVMVTTGDERGEPVSVAMAGMALGGGLMLLILAGTAGLVAMNAGELREWARTVSFAAAAAGVERSLRGIFVTVRQCGEFLRRGPTNSHGRCTAKAKLERQTLVPSNDLFPD
jgi:hypothetical protein